MKNMFRPKLMERARQPKLSINTEAKFSQQKSRSTVAKLVNDTRKKNFLCESIDPEIGRVRIER